MTVCLAEGMVFHTSCKQYQNSSKSDACFYFHQPPTFLTYLFAHSWTGISSSHLIKPISFQLLDLKFIASLYPPSSAAVAPNHPAGVLPIQASHEPENLTLKWPFHFSAATTVTLFNESQVWLISTSSYFHYQNRPPPSSSLVFLSVFLLKQGLRMHLGELIATQLPLPPFHSYIRYSTGSYHFHSLFNKTTWTNLLCYILSFQNTLFYCLQKKTTHPDVPPAGTLHAAWQGSPDLTNAPVQAN